MSDAENLPHPRETAHLFGHEAAERTLAAAVASGRVHHALLLAGPRGIGKATLAYRLARALLSGAHASDSLEVDPHHPVARQVAAGSHPDLVALHGDGEGARASGAVLVDDIRRVTHFFDTSAAADGWRVAIVDAAEDMNTAAANALLKRLEEPPQRSLIVLVSHTPGRLSRTIRSRCLRLSLAPLSPDALDCAARQALGRPIADTATLPLLAALAQGSLGRSVALADGGGLETFTQIRSLLADLPRLDLRAAQTFAERFASPRARDEFGLAVELLLAWLAGSIRLTAQGDGGKEAAFSTLPGRLAPFAEVWEKTARAARLANTYNLDRKHVLLSAFVDLAEAAR